MGHPGQVDVQHGRRGSARGHRLPAVERGETGVGAGRRLAMGLGGRDDDGHSAGAVFSCGVLPVSKSVNERKSDSEIH